MSAKELRNRRLARPYHGVRRSNTVDLDQPALRIADAIAVMTEGCSLAGWAARWLQGQAYCDGLHHGVETPVKILCGPGSHLRKRPGIQPCERLVLPGEIVDVGDVVVTTMARAAYDDMLDAPNPVEALVALEMATSTVIEQARTYLANVEAVYGSHVKTRGRRQARWALDHASTRSASPWETRTRLLAVDALGVERWLVNVAIFDLRENLLGIADLLEPESGLVLESDGADHRLIERHNEDNVREESFENHGLVVVRIGSGQHSRAERPLTIERVQQGHARARTNRSKRWTTEKPAWWWDWPPSRRWD